MLLTSVMGLVQRRLRFFNKKPETFFDLRFSSFQPVNSLIRHFLNHEPAVTLPLYEFPQFHVSMSRYIKFLCIFFLLTATLHAQKKRGKAAIDSMITVAAQQPDDTNKVRTWNRIASTYSTIEPAKGIEYGKKALILSITLDYDKGHINALNTIGLNYQYAGNYKMALEYYNQSLEVQDEKGITSSVALTLNRIATVYLLQGYYDKALDYNFKSLKVNETNGDSSGQAVNYGNIAGVYFYQKNYPKSLEYYNKALVLFESQHDKTSIGSTYSNIGSIHLEQGMASGKDSLILVALGYFEKAIKIGEELGNRDMIASNSALTGTGWYHLGDYSKALYFQFRALRLDEKMRAMNSIASVKSEIGTTYLELAKDSTGNIVADSLVITDKKLALAKALEYLSASIELNEKIGGDLNSLGMTYKSLSEAKALAGDHEGALASFKKFKVLQDSIFSNDSKVKIANLGTEKAEAESEQQAALNKIISDKRRNEAILFTTGILLLLIVIGFVVKERKRSEKLLLNILPYETAQELKRKGRAAAKDFQEVTVLFTDFKGFTQLAEKMTPQELVSEIDECFRAFDGIMERFGIEKIKTIGDAYMAAGGLPIANKTHAKNVVGAALEIRSFMETLNAKKKAAGKEVFEIRIGIHTGPVVAGIVGIKKFSYDIWGDTVNTASRMESSGEAGKVNISGTTYKEIMNDATFSFEFRGRVAAKNKGEIEMYFVEERK
jgi:adenylate cyclase